MANRAGNKLGIQQRILPSAPKAPEITNNRIVHYGNSILWNPLEVIIRLEIISVFLAYFPTLFVILFSSLPQTTK